MPYQRDWFEEKRENWGEDEEVNEEKDRKVKSDGKGKREKAKREKVKRGEGNDVGSTLEKTVREMTLRGNYVILDLSSLCILYTDIKPPL